MALHDRVDAARSLETASLMQSELYGTQYDSAGARAQTAESTRLAVQSGLLNDVYIEGLTTQIRSIPSSALTSTNEAELLATSCDTPQRNSQDFWEGAGRVVSDLWDGAVDEVVHHPDRVLLNAAVGAAATVAVVALAPELAIGLAVVGVAYAVGEIATHAGDWIHDADVVANPVGRTAAEVEESHQDLRELGGGTVDVAAGLASGLGAGVAISLASRGASAGAVAAAEQAVARPRALPAPEQLRALPAPEQMRALPAPEQARALPSPEAQRAPQDVSRAAASGEIAARSVTMQGADEAAWRASVREAIAQSQRGEPVTFNVDARTSLVNAEGRTITQADVLYEELALAFPENHFVFSKPNLRPGDPGYVEFAAPRVSTNGTLISTKENAMTTAREIILSDGRVLPAGSRFSVGTTYDGEALASASPSGRVWATTPDGEQIAVTEAGRGMRLTREAISDDPLSMGQVVEEGNHILVRTTNGTTPDGQANLDAYPVSRDLLIGSYRQGSQEGMWAPLPKQNDHFLLPANMTVQAETAYGSVTASGAERAYYMRSGFADAMDATANNYTGVTDARSAREILRIRAELGLEGPTQVADGLAGRS